MSKRRNKTVDKYRLIAAIIIAAAAVFGAIYGTHQEEEIAGNIEYSMKVHYIDVGEADSAFIELPDGKTMLIDAGEKENGEDVAGYVKSCGADRVDFLVGTHPHADHIGGLAEVVRSFEIGEIYMPRATHTSKVFEDLLLAIGEKNMQINTAKAGVNIIKSEEYSIDILGPAEDSYSNLNNYSAVIKITYNDVAFLFTGDAENEALRRIKGDVSADVLKVSHHGSDTADDRGFMMRVNPKYAVISLGEGNQYGHPHDSVMNLLAEVGAKVYRTDTHGTVIAGTDGKNIEFITSGE